jgi:hypothetical protein
MVGVGAPAIPATGSGEGVGGVGEVSDSEREGMELVAKAGTYGGAETVLEAAGLGWRMRRRWRSIPKRNVLDAG